jgi:hypothetical protein
VDERTIDLTDGKGKHRAEDTLPGGFIPSHLAAPMLRGSAATSLEYAATELGGIRLAADVLADPHGGLPSGDLAAAREIAETATRLQRLLRALAAGALAALVLTVGLAAGPSQRAEAAEAPQPDPVAVRTVPVVLSSAYVTVPVRGVIRGRWGCLDAWGPTAYGVGYVGRGCGYGPVVTVTARLDARFVPLGRSVLRLTDEANPLGAPAQAVTLDARRPSRFGQGTFLDMGSGDLWLSATLYAYTPAVGGLTPQRYSPVRVQELVGGRWLTRATLTTTARGVASGIVHLGGGVHVFRVARPAGSTVWSTTGRTRVMNLLTEPIDIV